MFAARLWFLSRWIGHHNVAILNGGFAAWKERGYPVATDVPEIPREAGTIAATPRRELVVDADWVRERLHREEMLLLDARAEDRFAGQNETVDPVAGHIPGARNRFFKQNFDETGAFKSPETLRAEFEASCPNPERVVHQCGSGVSAAANYFAMTHAGIGGSRIYAGSWSEWIADPSRPIATGSH
jgi:thiosulfate/3-mercaptopyruvate sulfurtransferase